MAEGPAEQQGAKWHERLSSIRHCLLDLDGTVYLGERVFPFTRPFLELLDRLEIRYSFVTNNNSQSPLGCLKRLHAKGIPATIDSIYTSTMATIAWLREQRPPLRRLFVLGTDSLRAEFVSAGFEEGGETPGDPPDAVVVGFDRSLTYSRLCRAAFWLSSGKPFIATHPDRICPTDEETVLPDCGAICACLEQATGREPDRVLGKPDPRMVQGALQRWESRPEEAMVVGDRLYTDMRMARESGALAVLVLTGETTAEEARSAPDAVDLIVRDLKELGTLLSSSLPPPP